MGTMTLIGAAVVAVVSALFMRKPRREEDPATTMSRDIKQISGQARSHISETSEQYLKDVRDNARRK